MYSVMKNLTKPNSSHVFYATKRLQHAAKAGDIECNRPKSFSEIPQPKGLPLLGTFLDYTRLHNFDVDRYYKFIQQRHQLLGPIFKENIVPGLTDVMVSTSSAKDVETFFRMNDRYPIRNGFEVAAMSRQEGGFSVGLTSAQNEQWYQMRKLFNEHLLTNKSIWNYTKAHFDIAFELADYIKTTQDQKHEVCNFNHLLYQWALECATVFTLDLKLGSFKGKVSKEAQDLIDVTLNLFQIWNRFLLEPPVYKYIKTKSFKKVCHYQAQQYEAVDNFVKSSGSVKSKLMEMVENSDLDLKDKASIVPEVLGAAVDTTSNGVGFYLYLLAANPDKQDILREEIKNVLKSGEVTGKKLQQMRYLHAVHLETERLYPRVVGHTRTTSRDTVFSGYLVPKGVMVVSTANVMNNRDPEFFENPNDFLPERWFKADTRKRFVMPGSFGMGPRKCPGRMMAHQETACLLIALLSKFKIEYHYEPLDVIVRVTNVLSKEPQFTFIPIED